MRNSVVQITKNPKIEEWLDEIKTYNTRKGYIFRMANFFEWYNNSVESFLELDQRQKRHTVLKFQSEKMEILSANTIAMTLGTINSFLDYHDQKINFKGKVVRKRIDLSSHVFTNGDLSKLFEIGNTKQKAYLALSVSLGWESSAIVNLKRKTLQGYIDRANSENKKYFYFMSQRQKTGSLRLGVLNPLALEWVSKWLIKSENKKRRKRQEGRNPAERISDVFDLGIKGLNRMLQTLTKQSQIKTTGRIHTHLLRKWVMGSLVKAGMNEWEVKFLVGKAIPATDFTYLQTLQNSIESKYPEAFEKHLNLETSSQSISKLANSLEEKDRILKEQKIQLEQLQKQYDNLHLEKLLERLQQLEKKLQKVNQ